MKNNEPPLVEKEGIAKIFSGELDRQIKEKKITQEAKIKLNTFKSQTEKLEDTPEKVRDSEAIIIAIQKAKEQLNL